MYKLNASEVEEFQRRYSARTPSSKRYGETFPHLADSRSTAGMRPDMKEMIYQIVANSGKGAHFSDIDGNEYLDIIMGFGVLLCGHCPDFLTQAITRSLQEEGLQLGPRHYLSGPVSQLVSEMTSMERAAFYSSGTEATMTAIRLVRRARNRVINGKLLGNKIVVFKNSYHGHYEDAVSQDRLSENEKTICLEYDATASLEEIEKRCDEIAAVIVEPVQSRNLALKPREFIKQLRALTKDKDIPLIFDEILTGFRIHQGGAQAWYGVKADLATYGKVIGGGLPIGAVAGSKRYMDLVDGGTDWRFGDDSYPKDERAVSMGTFNQNPHSMTAAFAMLNHMKEEGPSLQNTLTDKAENCFGALNTFFRDNGYPLEIDYFGAQFRFSAKRNLDLFYHHLIHQGVYVWEMRNLFLSTAHTDRDIEFFKDVVMGTAEAIFKRTSGKPKDILQHT